MNFSLEIGLKTDLSTLPNIKDVYITLLQGDQYKDVASKAKELVKLGKNPVPHFPARSIENEAQLKEISTKLSYSYSVCDVLKLNFADKLLQDLAETEILGIAYCIGSIDLKPLRITKTIYQTKL